MCEIDLPSEASIRMHDLSMLESKHEGHAFLSPGFIVYIKTRQLLKL
jgi:hypothetical protein